MAVTSKVYSPFPCNAWGSTSSSGESISLIADTINVMLVTSSHTISQAHGIKSSITNEVASGGGYTTGGATLGSKTFGNASLVSTFDAADVAWTSATFSSASAHIYDDSRATPVKPLVSYVDFGGTQTVTAATLALVWNASGIFTITIV